MDKAISLTGQYQPSKLPTLSLLRLFHDKNESEDKVDKEENENESLKHSPPAADFISLSAPRKRKRMSKIFPHPQPQLDEEEDAPDTEDQSNGDKLSLRNWVRPEYNEGVTGLHQEIEDFYTCVCPSAESHEARLRVLQRLRCTVTKVWPGCEVKVFGSFSTGLYLPSSDLDVVMFGLWEQIPFRCMERILQDIAIPHSVEIIENATVPIIRYDDTVTGIKVDVSFNNVSGLKSAEVIKALKLQFPALPKLLMVLKQFLLSRDLSTVFSGGLSSYSLSLMVTSFLQLHARTDTGLTSDQTNLGVLLLEFLDLYGHKFNYDSLAISVREVGY